MVTSVTRVWEEVRTRRAYYWSTYHFPGDTMVSFQKGSWWECRRTYTSDFLLFFQLECLRSQLIVSEKNLNLDYINCLTLANLAPPAIAYNPEPPQPNAIQNKFHPQLSPNIFCLANCLLYWISVLKTIILWYMHSSKSTGPSNTKISKGSLYQTLYS